MFDKRDWSSFKEIIHSYSTPFLTMHLGTVCKNYHLLKKLFSKAVIFYAVKANPHPDILKLLNELGASFDVASVYELNLLLNLNIDSQRISYGNTIKKKDDIAYAFMKGVRFFTTDSAEDLYHISECAPRASIFFRLATDGLGADWPLSRKFGCHQDTVYTLALLARKLKLNPYGLSFHVGSQQRDIGQWDEGISKCRYLFSLLREENIFLQCINLGGGLPASYYELTPPLAVYAKEILRYLEEDFEKDMPEIFVEPGRFLVADAGILVSEVILITRKSNFNLTRWVYLDVGKFNGLIETMDELIKYPIKTEKEKPSSPCILAGPTCDSMDILYEKFKYILPESLVIGDKVYFLTTGAYTHSYSSVGFNGFPPLKTFCYDL